jgi:putative oxidoreductase
MISRILLTSAPDATILIRLMVGGVFLSEGIQKFLYPAEVGAGRFARIGIPNPEVLGPFVGMTEILCGVLVILGLTTRLAVIPLLAVMCVALLTTKLPILLGRSIGPFTLRELPYYGIWGAAHEARTDLSMVFGLLFLLVVGAGGLSLDARWSDSRTHNS